MRKLPREVVVSSPFAGNVPCENAGSAAIHNARRTVASRRFIRKSPMKRLSGEACESASPGLRFAGLSLGIECQNGKLVLPFGSWLLVLSAAPSIRIPPDLAIFLSPRRSRNHRLSLVLLKVEH